MAVASPPMRIVHVSPYPLERASGINRLIELLAEALHAHGFETFLVAPGISSRPHEGYLRGIPVPIKSSRARNAILALRTFSIVIRNQPVDIVHVHQAHLQSLAGLVAARIRGLPTVLTLHLRLRATSRLRRLLQSALLRTVVALAKEAIAVADLVAADCGLSEVQVIRNGVPIPTEPARAPNRCSTPRLVFAGRVTASKGIFVLLEALATVDRVNPISLITFGPVDDSREYAAAKRRLGLESRVEDTGVDPGWLQRTNSGDVFVLPSFYEGMPLALLEAMANGLPVIATPVGGVPEVVIHGRTGLLVPVRDVRTLADAILWMAAHRDEASAMGREGRQIVAQDYSLGQLARAYESLYRRLLRVPQDTLALTSADPKAALRR